MNTSGGPQVSSKTSINMESDLAQVLLFTFTVYLLVEITGLAMGFEPMDYQEYCLVATDIGSHWV